MVAAVIVRVVDLIIQLTLIGLGVALIEAADDDESMLVLVLWSLLGTLYWVGSVIAVAVSVRRAARGEPRWLQRYELNPVVALVTTIATLLTSIVGVLAVVTILVLRNDEKWAGWVEPVTVYAMLLSWALFHWGFARIYERRYLRAVRLGAPRPLVFPGTDDPSLVDFVYFSFTNATAFSVSDVQVMTSSMRWRVVWHTTISFFLNALIVVLAFSTIINA